MKHESALLSGCCGSTASYGKIAEMDYDYIELSARQLMTLSDEEFRSFLTLYRNTGFPCRGFNDFCGPELPLVGPESSLNALTRYTEQVCMRGQALGIRTVGIGAPQARRLPEGYPAERADAEMAAFLRAASPIAARYGIVLLVEAVHQYLCNYMTRTEDALKMVRSLQLPNVLMVLDYYHAQVMGEDLHALAGVMPFVRHLHISTNLEHHVRGFLRQEDLALTCALLEEAVRSGYRGGISVEAAADFLEADGAACAKRMRQVLRQVCGDFPRDNPSHPEPAASCEQPPAMG